MHSMFGRDFPEKKDNIERSQSLFKCQSVLTGLIHEMHGIHGAQLP